jgi:putative ABC transport system permease protein
MFHDIRYALRGFRRTPAFTLTAIAVLAIGIGANSAVFSVVNTMLLKSVTVPEHDRVVQLMRRNQRFDLYCVGARDLMVWGRQTQILEDVTGYSYVPDEINLAGADAAEQISAEHVSQHYFHLFGARPALGRFFTPDEDRPGAGNFVVLSHGLWQRRFGSDPKLIGKSILLGGDPYTVVGVAGGDFRGDRSAELWFPLQADAAPTDSVCSLWGAGRLKPGVTLEQAKAALKIVAEEYKRTFPVKTTYIGLAAMPAEVTYTAEPMERIVTGDVRPALLVLLAAVGCVLLIGCANVANLLLVRATGRGREIAIRTSVGARRGRIVRQLLTESVILSLAGGALGVLLAAICIRALPAFEPMAIARIGPVPQRVALDGAVLGWTVMLSVLTGVLFGLVPALYASRVDLNRMLKEGGTHAGGGRQRVRGALVTAEVALSVILLITAGLLIRSFSALRSVDLGFDPHDVLVVTTAVTGNRFERPSAMKNMVERTEDRLRAIPGVEAISAEDSVPLLPNLGRSFVIGTREGGSRWRAVTPGYFPVFRIPVVEGRGFLKSDDARSPRVVVINQALARRYWREQNPIGQTLEFTNIEGVREPSAKVIGVVADVREIDLKDPPEPVVYVPFCQVDDGFLDAMRVWIQSLSWTIRTRVAPATLIPRIQQEVRDASGLPIGNPRRMDELVAASTAHDAAQTMLLGAFALVAILLAAVGLHGMLAYSAQQRRLEFGIRLALGATPAQLFSIILLQGMKSAGAGILIGWGGAFGLTRIMHSLLFGVKPADPLVFTAVPVLLGLLALLASYGTARRIIAMNPSVVMRYE